MRLVLLTVLPALLLFGRPVRAEETVDLSLGVSGGVESSEAEGAVFAYSLLGAAAFDSRYLLLSGELLANNAGEYNPTESWMGDYVFLLSEGKSAIRLGDHTLEGGYLKHAPFIDGGYDLFLNSRVHSSVGLAYEYDGPSFYYQTRWLQVNERSEQTYSYGPAEVFGEYWRDRGANMRIIGIRAGSLFFGLREAALYMDRSFDAHHLLSPLPTIFTNTLMTQGGNPWTQRTNDNSLSGLFLTYDGPEYLFSGQLLLDDINLNFLFPDDSPYIRENLNKIAWSLGGSMDFPFGTLGLYHAGATKYTFGATYASSTNPNTIPYEYAWYQDSVVGSLVIPPEENWIGYIHGENSLAFRGTYDTVLPRDIVIRTSLEWVLTGNQSPNNPWHQYRDWNEIDRSIELLGDGTIEHAIILDCRAAREFPRFSVSVDGRIEGIVNRQQLTYLDGMSADEPGIFVPMEGENGIDWSLTVTFTPFVRLTISE